MRGRIAFMHDAPVTTDLRDAARSILARPLRSGVAAGVLALGITACVVAFSMINGILLRPLPFPAGDRLIWMGAAAPAGRPTGLPISTAEQLSERLAGLLSGVAAYYRGGATLLAGEQADRVAVARMQGGLFPTLGVAPHIGRALGPADDRPGAPLVAVIGDSLWRSAFAASEEVLGTSIVLDGSTYEVVGVMPRSFDFPDEDVSVWTALEPTVGALFRSSDVPFVHVVGRLRPGTGIERARSAIRTVTAATRASDGPPAAVEVRSLHAHVVGDLRAGLIVLAVASAALLAIACLAVVTMQLAHLTERRHELTIRAALGASPARLARHAAIESTLIAAAAGALAIGASAAALRLAAIGGSAIVPEIARARIDWEVVAYAIAVAAIVTVVIGLVPLASLARLREASVLRDATRAASEGRAGVRIRDLLLGSSIAVSLTLVVGSGILARSLVQLLRVDLGFESRQVVRGVVRLPFQVVTPVERVRIRQIAAATLERAERMPGVTSVAISSTTPGQGNLVIATAGPEGSDTSAVPPIRVGIAQVTPAFFQTLRIPLLAGRVFGPAEDERARPVATIDEDVARALFPNADPVGQRLIFHDRGTQVEVIGVVGTARLGGRIAEHVPQVYVPYAQHPLPYIVVLARGSLTASDVRAGLRAIVREVDPQLPVLDVRLLDDLVRREVDRPGFYALVIGALAIVAVGLSCVGLYATASTLVANRTREIGIRIALGATPTGLAWYVIRRTVWISAAGVVVGCAMAIGATRILRTLLYGVGTMDLATYVQGAAVLFATAVLASFVPARRATAADPARALRE